MDWVKPRAYTYIFIPWRLKSSGNWKVDRMDHAGSISKRSHDSDYKLKKLIYSGLSLTDFQFTVQLVCNPPYAPLPRLFMQVCSFIHRVYSSSLMPRLYMQVWQPGTERKASIKVFLCCQRHALSSFSNLWE